MVHGDLAGRALAEHDSTAGVLDLWVRASAAGVAASLESSWAQRCAAAAATLPNVGCGLEMTGACLNAAIAAARSRVCWLFGLPFVRASVTDILAFATTMAF